MTTAETRIEKDSMGEMPVPADVLYGASTQRAVLNFPISGRPVPEAVIKAYAILKASCASVNNGLGRLSDRRMKDIHEACSLIGGGLTDFGGIARHFPIDIYQTGSGTSTNMNVNEVVANLACIAHDQPIGRSKDPAWVGDEPDGQGGVHPNDHVNMGQSSNDTFPTAMNIAVATEIQNKLIPAIEKLESALAQKAKDWDHIVKIGRTHLQDATPIRLGQVFSGYASQMTHAKARAQQALAVLGELAIGGTAVGTGINTHPDFGRLVAQEVSKKTGMTFREAENHFEAQATRDAAVEASGHMRTIAVSLTKIANDIRWLGSGPRCGIGELKVPAVQPGSSIMPGKVNPVICEAMMMLACQVMGNDAAVAAGGSGGIGSLLELNVAMPMMAASLLESVTLLANGLNVLNENLVAGLEADEKRCADLIEGSLAMCTSLVPVIGYDASAKLAYEAYDSGRTIRELALEKQILSAEQLSELLDPDSMTRPS
ncbi:MAG: class II fumarate hydratase [Phycisphaerales bacterium JB061]